MIRRHVFFSWLLQPSCHINLLFSLLFFRPFTQPTDFLRRLFYRETL